MDCSFSLWKYIFLTNAFYSLSEYGTNFLEGVHLRTNSIVHVYYVMQEVISFFDYIKKSCIHVEHTQEESHEVQDSSKPAPEVMAYLSLSLSTDFLL